MMWGLDQKLKEHTQMIDKNVDLKISNVSERLTKLDTDFQVYKLDCQERHRRFEDWTKSITISQQKQEVSQENTEKNVQCIKNILETYLPNLKDAEEKRATKHQLKEGALWVSAIVGAAITLFGLLAAIWAFSSGYLKGLVG